MGWIRQEGQAYCSWLFKMQQTAAQKRRWRCPAGYLFPKLHCLFLWCLSPRIGCLHLFDLPIQVLHTTVAR